jgi:ribosomal protein S18 acetylase RimI-like enzyme
MSGGVVVRAYREADEEQVVALWNEVFGYEQARNDPLLDVRRKRDAQPEFFLLAEEGGRVVGTVMGGYDGHRGWAHRLAVDPAQRRRGIGEALMRHLEAELDAAGCPKLNLQVRSDNAEVVAFYRRIGYAVEERVSLGKELSGAPK